MANLKFQISDDGGQNYSDALTKRSGSKTITLKSLQRHTGRDAKQLGKAVVSSTKAGYSNDVEVPVWQNGANVFFSSSDQTVGMDGCDDISSEGQSLWFKVWSNAAKINIGFAEYTAYDKDGGNSKKATSFREVDGVKYYESEEGVEYGNATIDALPGVNPNGFKIQVNPVMSQDVPNAGTGVGYANPANLSESSYGKKEQYYFCFKVTFPVLSDYADVTRYIKLSDENGVVDWIETTQRGSEITLEVLDVEDNGAVYLPAIMDGVKTFRVRSNTSWQITTSESV